MPISTTAQSTGGVVPVKDLNDAKSFVESQELFSLVRIVIMLTETGIVVLPNCKKCILKASYGLQVQRW